MSPGGQCLAHSYSTGRRDAGEALVELDWGGRGHIPYEIGRQPLLDPQLADVEQLRHQRTQQVSGIAGRG